MPLCIVWFAFCHHLSLRGKNFSCETPVWQLTLHVKSQEQHSQQNFFCQTVGSMHITWVQQSFLQIWGIQPARAPRCIGMLGDMSLASCQQRHTWSLSWKAPESFTNNCSGEQVPYSLFSFLNFLLFLDNSWIITLLVEYLSIELGIC